MEINFSNIRTHDGSKNSGFEELVCQLAHLQKPDNGVRFVKKEGAGGKKVVSVEDEWTMPIHNWSQALSQLDIYFEGRLDSVLDI